MRDGKDQAPKRKSAATRVRDLQDLKIAIVLKKDKLIRKSKELCIEIAALDEVLRLHAADYNSVDTAVRDAQAMLSSFEQSCTAAIDLSVVDSDDVLAAVAHGDAQNNINNAEIAGEGLDAQNNINNAEIAGEGLHE